MNRFSPDTIDGRRRRMLALASMILAVGVLVIALAVLLAGWAGGVSALRRIHADFPAMVPSTALCFALSAALIIWELRAPRPSRTSHRLALFVSGVVMAVAVVNLAVIAFTPAFGIDALLFADEPLFETDQMATATSLCFLFAALAHARVSAGLAPARKRAEGDRIFIAAASAGLVIALVALVGYLFDAEALYAVSPFTAMALHTALSFAALFTALLLSEPARGWVGVLTSDGPGGRAARRIVPAVALGPLLGAYLVLRATEAGLLNPDFRLALFAVLTMAALAALVLFQAGRSNASQRALQRALDERGRLLTELNHRVRNHAQMSSAILARARREAAEDGEAAAARAARRIEALAAPHRAHRNEDPADQVRADALMAAVADLTERALDPIVVRGKGEPDLISMDFATRVALVCSEICAETPADARSLTLAMHRGDRDMVLEVAHESRRAEAEETRPEDNALLVGLIKQLSAELIAAPNAVRVKIPAGAAEETAHG